MISGLGNQFELLPRISHSCIDKISQFNDHWKPYNPRKLNYGRDGLSLTSLDGQLNGIPDLDSLLEYNSLNNTNYDESSFKKRTAVVNEIPSLLNLFDIFGEHVSRSHLIRFRLGGFFPPHRDIYPLSKGTKTFRLFSLISFSTPSMYNFVLDGQLRFFVPGAIYYINTMLEHSFVSFADNLKILVLNIDHNEDSIRLIQSQMGIK
jgi:hypothetical protein